MCRNIRPLFNYDPPASEADMRDAALQYVRKVSGFTRPSKANEAAFEQAVEDVFRATRALVNRLSTAAPPRDRAVEVARLRARNAERYGAPRREQEGAARGERTGARERAGQRERGSTTA